MSITTEWLDTIDESRILKDKIVELKDLKKFIRILATLKGTASPVISCYLNLAESEFEHRRVLKKREYLSRQNLSAQARQDFEKALGQVEAFITTELLLEARGAAVFARAGTQPFLFPLHFQMLLPTWIVTNSTPYIYPLIELKNTYHRYVETISTEPNFLHSARSDNVDLMATLLISLRQEKLLTEVFDRDDH